MIVKQNESLKSKTTFHVGGTAKNFFVPEGESELIELVCSLLRAGESFKVLSGGSNILINDKKEFDNVIYMEKAAKDLVDEGNGHFYVGASNRIQEVIHFVNDKEYGGFEELIGLPAMFGGIIYMNAGIGARKSVRFNISEFIEKVKVVEIKTGTICWLKRDDCGFGYRCSIFQNDEFIILGAELMLHPQTKEESQNRITKRVNYCKNNQEWGKGCFGSCFSESNGKILKIIRALSFRQKGVYQSAKSANWLVNDGTASYDDAMKWIKLCVFSHKLFCRKIECEVRIWD